MQISEEQIQNTSLSQIIAMYPELVISVSLSGINLSKMDPTSRAKLVRQLKQGHLANGLPDVSIYLPNSVTLNLEFKTPKGYQSQYQKDIQAKLHKLDHTYYIVKSTIEALTALNDNLTTQYRSECFEALVATLSEPKLTEQFLFFTKDTPTTDVYSMLKQMYNI